MLYCGCDRAARARIAPAPADHHNIPRCFLRYHFNNCKCSPHALAIVKSKLNTHSRAQQLMPRADRRSTDPMNDAPPLARHATRAPLLTSPSVYTASAAHPEAAALYASPPIAHAAQMGQHVRQRGPIHGELRTRTRRVGIGVGGSTKALASGPE